MEGTMEQLTTMDRFVTLDKVAEIVGLPKSTLQTMLKKGSFPAPASIGTRKRRWLMADVKKWFSDISSYKKNPV